MNSSKHKPIHFLEIGVFYGASLKMWADYFTHTESKIVGADWFKGIQGNSSTFADPKFILNQKVDPRIQFVELNQASLQELQTFKNTSTMFDYILDDGSHLMKDQQQTFGVLFDLIKPGGYFIIEDIHTSFQPGYDVSPNETTTYAMVEALQKKTLPKLAHYTLPESILDQIEDVEIYRVKNDSITCYIKKKD
jgi:cephalosporin hydroxylase